MNDNSSIWMFHYVQPESGRLLPQLNCCSLEQFRMILDWLQERFTLPSPHVCLDHIASYGVLPKGSSLLTFDDGTQDHWQWVYPELLKRNLSGIFFVSTAPLAARGLLKVHKAHILYGSLGYDKFFENFKKSFLKNNGNAAVFNDHNAENAYPYDTRQIAGFKYAINFKINSDEVESIFDDLLYSIKDVNLISNNYYLTQENIKEMKENGMVFGFHGHSHKAFSTLPEKALLDELRMSKNFFLDTIGEIPNCISYPFGDINCVRNEQVVSIRDFGVKVGFLAEENSSKNPMKTSRVDCLELMKLTN